MICRKYQSKSLINVTIISKYPEAYNSNSHKTSIYQRQKVLHLYFSRCVFRASKNTNQAFSHSETEQMLKYKCRTFVYSLNRSQHPVNCCIDYFIKFFIVCFRHKCCCIFIRNKFNKITEGFFVFSLTYNIEYYTE